MSSWVIDFLQRRDLWAHVSHSEVGGCGVFQNARGLPVLDPFLKPLSNSLAQFLAYPNMQVQASHFPLSFIGLPSAF